MTRIQIQELIADPNLTIAEILALWPEAGLVFLTLGLTCMGCAMARFHTIDEAAPGHGVTAEAMRGALLRVIEDA